MRINEIDAEATLGLRRRVLWPDKSIEFCRVEGDEDATHYGAYLNDSLIGVASVYGASGSARLRKFAVDEEHQGRGVGSAMLIFIIHSMRQSDVSTFWCDARQSATQFYERFGLCVEGDRFYKSGVPYYKMTLKL